MMMAVLLYHFLLLHFYFVIAFITNNVHLKTKRIHLF